MDTVFADLYSFAFRSKKEFPETAKSEAYSEKTYQLLKNSLNKNQRKLLLRIIDEKDLLAEEQSICSFKEGVRLGLKIGYEANKDI